ncbi:hypothetical protein BKA58DRAFT_416367 [Alternaria rosae]|uniref:uncharacterized protein n=1 Tax=Alternaria rosae TaxID=1187941 RepID=UPI001E8DEF86|nr:uncharacterized protein BKA58DRAFT_416367 [Alternaria rosae]KAH6882384.1 hypothetical protein BKA58DRAFT_416367 [Alternaria rosae]
MQFTALVALFAAAASAAPGTISSRQTADGSVRARFYDETSCGGNGVGVAKAELILTPSATEGKAGCVDLTIGPYRATFFDQSTLKKTIRVFNVACSEVGENLDQGNWIDIGPGNTNLGCKTLTVRSYLTKP